jgi:hypothetical protein
MSLIQEFLINSFSTLLKNKKLPTPQGKTVVKEKNFVGLRVSFQYNLLDKLFVSSSLIK